MREKFLLMILSSFILLNLYLLILTLRYYDIFCVKPRTSGAVPEMAGQMRSKSATHYFMVALGWMFEGDPEINVFCSGSIISKNWLVSAHHCINTLEMYSISLNDVVAVGNNIEYAKGIPHKVQELISYESKQHDADLLLVRVEEPFTNNNEKPIDIAKKGYSYEAKKMVTVMGWGYTDIHIPVPSRILHEVELQLYEHKQCLNILSNVSKLEEPLPEFTNQNFCAGLPENDSLVDSCNVESGGSLVDGNLLIGILSWGIQDEKATCGSAYPGVYVSVWKFESWIHSIEKKKREKIASFK